MRTLQTAASRLWRPLLACLLLVSLAACRQQAPEPAAPDPAAAGGTTAPAAADPLPSWRDGATKQAILDYVGAATTEGGPGHVPPEARFAIFDNDGTLWAEQPIVQLEFVATRIAELASQQPEVATLPAVKALQAKDLAFFHGKDGEKHVVELLSLVSAGMSPQDHAAQVQAFFASARHPTLGVPYRQTTYQPMIELLQYLRANGFQTWIVSGGGIDFMRPWAQSVYGIPPWQVIGSQIEVTYNDADGPPRFDREPEVFFVDDKAGKPVGILRHIGREPAIAFGNSDGDFEMLEYVTAGDGPDLGLIVHHTDATREWAYDRNSRIGTLARALDAAPEEGWLLIDMARDWKVIYPFEQP
jgi:haloacid dehalogenase-like hydrolase